MNPNLELARTLLADAELMLRESRERSAASRAYYASYHACIALLAGLNLSPGNFTGRSGWPAARWEHGIIVAAVVTHPRLLGVLTRPVATQVRWQYLQRIRADYRPRDAVSALVARTTVHLAQQIVHNVASHLNA